jgi:hypothetical protein
MRFLSILTAAIFLAAGVPAFATPTDEIQVYTGDIEPVGVFGLTWHNNFTPNGLKTPSYPGSRPGCICRFTPIRQAAASPITASSCAPCSCSPTMKTRISTTA